MAATEIGKNKSTCITAKLSFITAAFSLGLAGCSGEPSESDMIKATQKNIDLANAQMEKMSSMAGNLSSALGGSAKIQLENTKTELHSLKKISCTAAQGSPGYVCDIEIDITAPMVGRNKSVVKARFVKGSDGWQAAQ